MRCYITTGKSGVSDGDGGSVRQVPTACNGQQVASSGQQAAGGARAAGRAGSNPAHASDNVQQSARENSWQLSQVALRARALEYGGRRHATRRMRREAARLRREIGATAPAPFAVESNLKLHTSHMKCVCAPNPLKSQLLAFIH